MKTILFSISFNCLSIFATAQADSLSTYLNMCSGNYLNILHIHNLEAK